MAYVWRVQTLDGSGAYMEDACDFAYDCDGRHPGPYNDIGLQFFWSSLTTGQRSEWFFGFKSLAQYKAWFHKASWRSHLAKFKNSYGEGLYLVRFKVRDEDLVRGFSQVIFRRAMAQEIDIRACDEV